MSNASLEFSMRRSKIILTPFVLGMIYIIGVPAFIFLWTGQQFMPGFAGFEQYGPIYAVLCLISALFNFAIVKGYRWGIAGQIIAWVFTSAINFMLSRNIGPTIGPALLVIGVWAFDIYRNRHLLH